MFSDIPRTRNLRIITSNGVVITGLAALRSNIVEYFGSGDMKILDTKI
jgi:hypothetical protein